MDGSYYKMFLGLIAKTMVLNHETYVDIGHASIVLWWN